MLIIFSKVEHKYLLFLFASYCLADNSSLPCAADSAGDGGGTDVYMAVFVIGQMLHGVGGAGIYTLAIPYMDSNIQTKNTALYIGERDNDYFNT